LLPSEITFDFSGEDYNYIDPEQPVPLEFTIGPAGEIGGDSALACYVDGEPVETSVEGNVVTFPPLKLGEHTLCCEITVGGIAIAGCTASDCIEVKVKIPCDGSDDSECTDGNPCSIDSCVFTTEGYECHYGMDLQNPNCCQSHHDCPCTDSGWISCDELTHNCSYSCLADADCDDDNICTVDTCPYVDGTMDCVNEPIDGCCQIDADCTAGDICQDNVCVENTYTCSDILLCATGCNFSEQCISQCFEGATEESQAIFSDLALCVVIVCGQNIDVACFLGATAGTCADQLAACQGD